MPRARRPPQAPMASPRRRAARQSEASIEPARNRASPCLISAWAGRAGSAEPEGTDMSMVATFHTLSKSRLGSLVTFARPQTRVVERRAFLFKRKAVERVDDFWHFLSKHAIEQERFPFSGVAFVNLDLLLEERGCALVDLGDCDVARKVSNARQTQVAIFDHGTAGVALAKLNQFGLQEAEVRVLCREECPGEDEEEETEAVLAAFDIAKRWLGSVGEAEIGLMMVG